MSWYIRSLQNIDLYLVCHHNAQIVQSEESIVMLLIIEILHEMITVNQLHTANISSCTVRTFCLVPIGCLVTVLYTHTQDPT